MGSVLFVSNLSHTGEFAYKKHYSDSYWLLREYVVSNTDFQPMIGLYKPESGLLGSSRRIFINVERPGIFFNDAGIHGHLTHIVQ